jgi:hypothetical protein
MTRAQHLLHLYEDLTWKAWYHASSGKVIKFPAHKMHQDMFPRQLGSSEDAMDDGWVRVNVTPRDVSIETGVVGPRLFDTIKQWILRVAPTPRPVYWATSLPNGDFAEKVYTDFYSKYTGSTSRLAQFR